MRRPATIERAGALTPRDRVWRAIRLLGEFSVADVMLLSEQRDDTALTYLRGLQKAGIVKSAASSPYAARRREFRRFSLVRDVGAHAPRVTGDGEAVSQGEGRQAMWNVIRHSREDLGWRDIAFRASTPRLRIAADEAQFYARMLWRAGYLALARAAEHRYKGAAVRYRFIISRNTGPRAPLVTREKSVVDGNSGTVLYERNNGHNRIAADVNSVSGKISGRRETRLPRRVGAEAQCRPAPWA